MTKIAISFSAITITLGLLLHAGAVGATPLRNWVSGAGSDSNPCTRAAPCATFDHAFGVTPGGGEIDVLDGGEFGPVLIDKAITIANDGAGTAGITGPVSDGSIKINAASIDVVVLRGLTINQTASSSGIDFLSGASLLIDHCRVQGPGGVAIAFEPTGNARLRVTDTVVSSSGSSNLASIAIAPEGGAAVVAHFERVRILDAIGNGIRVDGTLGAGAIDVELHEVTVDGASGGSGIVAVSATSGGAAVKLVADSVTASHNAGYGFRAVGGSASVTLSHSVSEDNGVGLGASGGGVVYSYGDNRFANNSSGNGVTPTAIPQE